VPEILKLSPTALAKAPFAIIPKFPNCGENAGFAARDGSFLSAAPGTRVVRSLLLILPLLAGSVVVLATPTAYALPTSPTLGAAGSYSVLGGTTVTNVPATTMPGDLGVSPGSAVTGSPTVGPPGTIHAADVNAGNAQSANTAAFGVLDQTCTTNYGAVTQDLTLVSPLGPGVYCANAFILTGNLTLTGSGVWIFKSVLSTLITSPASSVTGGDPCNIWWRVASSATLDTTTSFEGSILALTTITLNTGATLNGRALTQTGAVNLHQNVITGAACLTANTGNGGGSGGGNGGGAATAVTAGPNFTG
jgi:hypothetical protein